MKPPLKSETESAFAFEDIKGTESLPMGAGREEFSKEEKEMYDMMKDYKRGSSDVVSSMDEKFEVEIEK